MDLLASIFLFPTLAGYIYLTKSELFRLKCKPLTPPLLILESIVFGVAFLYVVYIVKSFYNMSLPDIHWTNTFFENLTNLIKLIISPITQEVGTHNLATTKNQLAVSLESVSTLILSLLALSLERCFMRAKPDLFKSYQSHLRSLDSGELEKLLSYSMDSWVTIQLTLCNRKVYIGNVIEMPTHNAAQKHQRFFRLLPLYSSYRDSERLKISDDITDYSLFALMLKDDETREKYKVGQDDGISQDAITDALKTGVLIDVEDVQTAQLFDSKVFHAFNDNCATSVPKKNKKTKKIR